MPTEKPLVIITAPSPRTLDLIFTDAARQTLEARYELVDADPDRVSQLPDAVLARARFILGQPPIDEATLAA